MARIGRNEKCPCGSGRKFKHCCARTPLATRRTPLPEEQLKISLGDAVEGIRHAAEQKKQVIRELGVFVLLSTAKGNAWLFEATQSDCVQLARDGETLPVFIDENQETIEIDWGYTFALIDREIELTSYRDRTRMILTDCPVKELSASLRRIRKKVPAEILKEIHIEPNKN